MQGLTAERPYEVLREWEPDGCGRRVPTTTVFLTAATCPIGCSMCDLHQFTLDRPTPRGAIPRQILHAISGHPVAGWIKLYNSGNFFDPRSIPPEDYQAIAQQCVGFERIIVENHPRFGSERLTRFVRLLEGRPLEVAVGLETVQPRWLARMQKHMTRDQFDHYATTLRRMGVDVRVFLIVGVPGISASEAIRWARLSLRHAIAVGARHVSLIPARRGNGWNGSTKLLPSITMDDWLEFHATALQDAGGRAAVTVDLWEMDAADPRVEQLKQANLDQRRT